MRDDSAQSTVSYYADRCAEIIRPVAVELAVHRGDYRGIIGLVVELRMAKFDRTTLSILPLGLIMLCGCQDLLPHDTQSLVAPRFTRSEIIGFLAGLGTTIAAVPDLITMIKRRSSAGLNPDGGNHRRLSDPVGLLWFVDRFVTGDRMERDRSPDQFPMRRRVWLFRLQRKSRIIDKCEKLPDGSISS